MSIEGQCHFDVVPRYFIYENLAFQNYCAIFNQIWLSILALRYKEIKFHEHDAGHMTKMAAMPIYGKNTLNTFKNLLSRNQWADFNKA